MGGTPTITPERHALVLAYRAGRLTVRQIQSRHRVSASQLYRVLKRAGEPLRGSRSVRPAPAAPKNSGRPARAPTRRGRRGAPEALEARLRRLLAENLAELERCAGPNGSGDPDRIGRALALAARTMIALRRNETEAGPDPDDDDRPPRTLSELRDELRGHLERLREEGGYRDGPRPDEPDPA